MIERIARLAAIVMAVMALGLAASPAVGEGGYAM